MRNWKKQITAIGTIALSIGLVPASSHAGQTEFSGLGASMGNHNVLVGPGGATSCPLKILAGEFYVNQTYFPGATHTGLWIGNEEDVEFFGTGGTGNDYVRMTSEGSVPITYTYRALPYRYSSALSVTCNDGKKLTLYDITLSEFDPTNVSWRLSLSYDEPDYTDPIITGPSGGPGAATSAVSVNEEQRTVATFTSNEPIHGWSISGADASKFVIIANTGELSFKTPYPDFENPSDENGDNVYSVTVKATEASGNYSSQDVTVTVLDVDESPATIMGPSGGAGAATSSVNVAENTTFVTTLSANKAVTWTLTDGVDRSYFAIAADGTITFKNAPNYESPYDSGRDNTYVVTATATAAGGFTSEQTITVTVTDIDESSPIVSIAGPQDTSNPEFLVTFTFNEQVTGFMSDDIIVTNGSKGSFQVVTSGLEYTLAVTSEMGATVEVSVPPNVATDAQGNGNLEAYLSVELGVSEQIIAEASKAIVASVSHTTTSAVATNATMMSQALGRFSSDSSSGTSTADAISTSSVKNLAIKPEVNAIGKQIGLGGTFFGQSVSADGVYRRVTFGEFDVQHTLGSGTTLSFNGRMSWERAAGEDAMVAYFLGAEFNKSDVEGVYTGDINRVGLSAGVYGFKALADNLFLGGYGSLGVSRSEMDTTDGEDSNITGDYLSRTLSLGAQLSGSIEYDTFEVRPSASLSYVKTFVGDITLDDSGTSFEVPVGNTAFARLTLSPEFLFPMELQNGSNMTTVASVAPRVLCEMNEASDTITRECGAGLTFGINTNSKDGATNLNASIRFDRVGGVDSKGLNLQAQFRF